MAVCDLSYILFQFLVMLIQSKQDREPLSVLALVCLCPAEPLSLFLLSIPKQDQESLSSPYSYCLCQAGLLPGQLALCRHRTVTLNPGLVNLESFMETSRSAGALS